MPKRKPPYFNLGVTTADGARLEARSETVTEAKAFALWALPGWWDEGPMGSTPSAARLKFKAAAMAYVAAAEEFYKSLK